MEKYISKTALVAEIEKLISNGQVKLQESQESNDHENYIVWAEHIATCIKVLSLIDTLEMKEVDLKKELDYDDYIAFFKEHPEYNNGDWGFDECWVFAKYFFELGLKAQKGK